MTEVAPVVRTVWPQTGSRVSAFDMHLSAVEMVDFVVRQLCQYKLTAQSPFLKKTEAFSWMPSRTLKWLMRMLQYEVVLSVA